MLNTRIQRSILLQQKNSMVNSIFCQNARRNKRKTELLTYGLCFEDSRRETISVDSQHNTWKQRCLNENNGHDSDKWHENNINIIKLNPKLTLKMILKQCHWIPKRLSKMTLKQWQWIPKMTIENDTKTMDRIWKMTLKNDMKALELTLKNDYR